MAAGRYRGRGPRPLLTAGQLVTGQLLIGVVGLLVNILAARSMGPVGRGGFALFLQITYLANTLALAGVDRSYPATAGQQRDPLRAGWQVLRLVTPTVLLTLASVAPVISWVAGGGANGAMTAAGFALTACALIGTTALRTGAAATGAGRGYLLATTVGQLSLLVVSVGLLVVGNEAAPVWLCGYGAALCTGPLVAWLVLGRARRAATPSRADPRPARRLGLRLLPATLATMVMLRADRLLLPWLGSYGQLGLYIVVAAATEIIVWPVQAYVDAQTPRWHRQFLAGELRPLRLLTCAVAYGALAAVALMVGASLLLVPVFGPAYEASLRLVVPLALAAACYAIGRVAVGLGIACGRARVPLAADSPAMLVALALYVLLIPEHGAMGAAVGSLAGYAVGASVAGLLCLRIRHPVHGCAPEPVAASATAGVVRS